MIFLDMEKKKNIFEFQINPTLYKKLITQKNYKLPAIPMAIIKATAPLEQKRKFKRLFWNKAGIYGWMDLQNCFCYVGSSVRLHIRPWQHFSGNGNKNLKNLFKQQNLNNFVLIIFETFDSFNEVTAPFLESKENLYLQKYIPKEFLLNVLFFAYTNFGYKHNEETKKRFSLMRKGKKGQKRPDLEGPSNPMYGLTKEQNPFFGQKHTQESLQKISEIAKQQMGLKHPRSCPVKIQKKNSFEFRVFATKTEAAKFLAIRKANTITQYVRNKKLFKNTWFMSSLTKEEFKTLQLILYL